MSPSNTRCPLQPCAGHWKSQEESVKHKHFVLITAVMFAFSSPAFAQRGHGGGPPASHGPGAANPSGAGANTTGHTNMSHASPGTVLSHNTAIAKKITALTNIADAKTACDGFKNLGRCVAAAHVANNLNITGGFLALKAKITGTGAMSLGKAIQSLDPNANAKAEVKKANKQADDDMKEAETSS